MTPARAAAALALIAALSSGCGGSDDPVATTATQTTATTPTVQTAADVPRDGQVTPADVAVISFALRRISSECVRRRKSERPVGRPSEAFRTQVAILIAEFEDTPSTKFKAEAGTREITMRSTLLRIGSSLAVKAPKGCGANSREGGGTAAISKQIRRALARPK